MDTNCMKEMLSNVKSIVQLSQLLECIFHIVTSKQEGSKFDNRVFLHVCVLLLCLCKFIFGQVSSHIPQTSQVDWLYKL